MDPSTFSGHQFQLFEEPSVTAPQRNYDPQSWSNQPDVSWHSSNQPTMPQESENQGNFGEGFHVGTRKSAEERGEGYRGFIHPVRHSGSMALRDDDEFYPAQKFDEHGESKVDDPRTMVFSDVDANYHAESIMTNRSDEFPGREQLTVPYVNASEDQGSISYRAPRENVRTWGEDVAADPGASRHHKLMAEQYDLTDPVGHHKATQEQNKENNRRSWGMKYPGSQGRLFDEVGGHELSEEQFIGLPHQSEGLQMRKRHSWDEDE